MATPGLVKGLGPRSNSSNLPPRFPKQKLPRGNSDVRGLGKNISNTRGQRYERLGDRVDFERDGISIGVGFENRPAEQVVEADEPGNITPNDEHARRRENYSDEQLISMGVNKNKDAQPQPGRRKSYVAKRSTSNGNAVNNNDTRDYISTIEFSEISNEKSEHWQKGGSDKESKEKKSTYAELPKRPTVMRRFTRAMKPIFGMRQKKTQGDGGKPNKLDRSQTMAPSSSQGIDSARSSHFEMGSIPHLRRQSMRNRTASQLSCDRSKSRPRKQSSAYTDFDVSEPELQRSNSQIDLQMMKKMLEAKECEVQAAKKEIQAEILKKEAEEMRKNPRRARVRRETNPTANIAKAAHNHTTASAALSSNAHKKKNNTTEPKPFKLGGVRVHERTQKRKEEKKKADEEEKRLFGKFKARPLPSFYKRI